LGASYLNLSTLKHLPGTAIALTASLNHQYDC